MKQLGNVLTSWQQWQSDPFQNVTAFNEKATVILGLLRIVHDLDGRERITRAALDFLSNHPAKQSNYALWLSHVIGVLEIAGDREVELTSGARGKLRQSKDPAVASIISFHLW